MKKNLFCMLAIAMIAILAGCQQKNPDECRIHGIVVGEQYEGKRIFLVPLEGEATAATVDSVEIKNGKFEFATTNMQMYKILVDIHYRLNVQPIIIVGEPGDVRVSVDSVSHASGTPQNDSLEQWKLKTELHNIQYYRMQRTIAQLKQEDNEQQAAAYKQQCDSIHIAYKNYTRRMASNMKEGVLHDFLVKLFPTTYQKKLPDGRIATMNADTNEEIAQ